MVKILAIVLFVIIDRNIVDCYPDLTPEAITVYRNPEFFKNLNYGGKVNYNQKSAKVPQGKPYYNYKYPGETKKPNPPPASPTFGINFDNSPEFRHEPRDIFVDVNYKPSRRKGPYSPIYRSENKLEQATKPIPRQQTKEVGSEEEDDGENESFVDNSEDDVQDYGSLLSPNPDEEFKAYHEPILLAQPGFDPDQSSGFVSSTYSKPYAYNRTSPVLYDDWKHYTYPKIHSRKNFRPDLSPLYSEEPASSHSPSYYSYDDETEDVTNFFENNEYKNVGSDTKHIYQKLLKPKKSILFKFHSKPKFKKLKLKLKKKHLHSTDWFNEYPFNF